MTAGVASERPLVVPDWARTSLAAGAAVVVAAAVVPPLAVAARRYEFAEAIQFALLALAAPALLVAGAPWRRLHLAASPADAPAHPARLDRLAAARRRHPRFVRSAAFLVADLAVIVAWRTPPAVDAVVRHPWLLAGETASLLVAGTAFWLECVESSPLVPRLGRPARVVLCTACMWTVWTVSYLQGMSQQTWYRALRHAPGAGPSAAADRQLATVVLFAAAAVVWLPVIYWNLVQWLRSEDDPDQEFQRLLREERRRRGVPRSRLVPPGPGSPL